MFVRLNHSSIKTNRQLKTYKLNHWTAIIYCSYTNHFPRQKISYKEFEFLYCTKCTLYWWKKCRASCMISNDKAILIAGGKISLWTFHKLKMNALMCTKLARTIQDLLHDFVVSYQPIISLWKCDDTCLIFNTYCLHPDIWKISRRQWCS
jgi:hypothetical protein